MKIPELEKATSYNINHRFTLLGKLQAQSVPRDLATIAEWGQPQWGTLWGGNPARWEDPCSLVKHKCNPRIYSSQWTLKQQVKESPHCKSDNGKTMLNSTMLKESIWYLWRHYQSSTKYLYSLSDKNSREEMKRLSKELKKSMK